MPASTLADTASARICPTGRVRESEFQHRASREERNQAHGHPPGAKASERGAASPTEGQCALRTALLAMGRATESAVALPRITALEDAASASPVASAASWTTSSTTMEPPKPVELSRVEPAVRGGNRREAPSSTGCTNYRLESVSYGVSTHAHTPTHSPMREATR